MSMAQTWCEWREHQTNGSGKKRVIPTFVMICLLRYPHLPNQARLSTSESNLCKQKDELRLEVPSSRQCCICHWLDRWPYLRIVVIVVHYFLSKPKANEVWRTFFIFAYRVASGTCMIPASFFARTSALSPDKGAKDLSNRCCKRVCTNPKIAKLATRFGKPLGSAPASIRKWQL